MKATRNDQPFDGTPRGWSRSVRFVLIAGGGELDRERDRACGCWRGQQGSAGRPGGRGGGFDYRGRGGRKIVVIGVGSGDGSHFARRRIGRRKVQGLRGRCLPYPPFHGKLFPWKHHLYQTNLCELVLRVFRCIFAYAAAGSTSQACDLDTRLVALGHESPSTVHGALEHLPFGLNGVVPGIENMPVTRREHRLMLGCPCWRYPLRHKDVIGRIRLHPIGDKVRHDARDVRDQGCAICERKYISAVTVSVSIRRNREPSITTHPSSKCSRDISCVTEDPQARLTTSNLYLRLESLLLAVMNR